METKLKGWLKNLKLSESTISMILGALVVVVVGVLVFNYFSQTGQKELVTEVPSEVELTVEKEKKLPTTHEVKPGEHLWNIALKYYQDGYQWTQIAQANNLVNPNLIEAGQKLTIPKIEAVETVTAQEKSITSEKYTVKRGDCLWFIALRAYGDPYKWTEIAEVNKLTNPDLIHAGNEFIIPR